LSEQTVPERIAGDCFCQIEDVDGFGIRPLKLGDKKAFRSHGLSGT